MYMGEFENSELKEGTFIYPNKASFCGSFDDNGQGLFQRGVLRLKNKLNI